MTDLSPIPTVDPAALFCCAVSLRDAAMESTGGRESNLGEEYNGWDEFLRQVMAVATRFETWATDHVAFEALGEVWPYFMEDRFGAACVEVVDLWHLAEFGDEDCVRVAQHLGLPLILDESLHIPLDVRAPNPVEGSAFHEFCIRAIRYHLEDEDPMPLAAGGDPWDPEWTNPVFAIYGVQADGIEMHITDLPQYRDAVVLVGKLSPGIQFPEQPIVNPTGREVRSTAFCRSITRQI